MVLKARTIDIRKKYRLLYEDYRKESNLMNKKTLLGIIPIAVFAALQTVISEIRMDMSIKDAVKEEIANQKSKKTEEE